MFAAIVQWLKGLWSKMIGVSDVKQALSVDIAISQSMATALQLWSNMYVNKAPWLDDDIKSMNLPAAIAGEISRAVTIEMKVTIDGSPRADFLAAQFEKVMPKLREMIEFGNAKGGLMLKPYVDGTELAVDFVQADQFYPVAFDANGKIISCVFSDSRTIGGKYYTRLEYHTMTPEGCYIKNQAFRSETAGVLGVQIPLTAVDAWKDLEPEATIQGVEKPLFGYFRYPLANNIDPTSPLGVSCYARAIDLIKQADVQWSDILWEMESGKRALYVDVLAFGKDKDGKPVLPNKRLYRTLQGGGNVGDEDMFHEWSPALREVNLLNALDAILRKIEFNCGLAYGTLSNPQTIDKTATELRIGQQRSAATVVDAQKSLHEALDELLYAMDTWATLNNLAPVGKYNAVYDFDDSIVIDKDTQMMADRQTVTMGAMPKWMFLTRNYGLSEDDAKKWIAANQAEQPASTDFFGNPTPGQ